MRRASRALTSGSAATSRGARAISRSCASSSDPAGAGSESSIRCAAIQAATSPEADSANGAVSDSAGGHRSRSARRWRVMRRIPCAAVSSCDHHAKRGDRATPLLFRHDTSQHRNCNTTPSRPRSRRHLRSMPRVSHATSSVAALAASLLGRIWRPAQPIPPRRPIAPKVPRHLPDGHRPHDHLVPPTGVPLNRPRFIEDSVSRVPWPRT